MSAGNIHWGVKCELERRGGLRAEKRIAPEDVDGIIRQLAESNHRTEGVQKEVGGMRASPPGLGAIRNDAGVKMHGQECKEDLPN